TYKYAYFDWEQWRELVPRIERERGAEFALCYYNDRPAQRSTTAPGPEPTVDDVLAAAALPTPITWTELPFFNERLMVTVDNVDVAEAVTLLVYADTWLVPPAEMAELARSMEDLAIAAAGDDKVPTGVGALERSGI
ncbi:MAG: hypothetical protein ACJ786_08330, partial [Catenulispora sp.]